jgi:hypothetical protein
MSISPSGILNFPTQMYCDGPPHPEIDATAAGAGPYTVFIGGSPFDRAVVVAEVAELQREGQKITAPIVVAKGAELNIQAILGPEEGYEIQDAIEWTGVGIGVEAGAVTSIARVDTNQITPTPATITAKLGTSTKTVTVVVVEVAHIQKGTDNVEGTTIVVPVNAPLTLTALVNPANQGGEALVTWSGTGITVNPTSGTTFTVNTSQATATPATITATCGTTESSKTVTVVVVGVQFDRNPINVLYWSGADGDTRAYVVATVTPSSAASSIYYEADLPVFNIKPIDLQGGQQKLELIPGPGFIETTILRAKIQIDGSYQDCGTSVANIVRPKISSIKNHKNEIIPNPGGLAKDKKATYEGAFNPQLSDLNGLKVTWEVKPTGAPDSQYAAFDHNPNNLTTSFVQTTTGKFDVRLKAEYSNANLGTGYTSSYVDQVRVFKPTFVIQNPTGTTLVAPGPNPVRFNSASCYEGAALPTKGSVSDWDLVVFETAPRGTEEEGAGWTAFSTGRFIIPFPQVESATGHFDKRLKLSYGGTTAYSDVQMVDVVRIDDIVITDDNAPNSQIGIPAYIALTANKNATIRIQVQYTPQDLTPFEQYKILWSVEPDSSESGAAPDKGNASSNPDSILLTPKSTSETYHMQYKIHTGFDLNDNGMLDSDEKILTRKVYLFDWSWHTIKSAANGTTPDTRTTIGVCEKVRIMTSPQYEVTWTANAGLVVPKNGKDTTFTAGDRAAKPSITATFPGGSTAAINFNVIAPNAAAWKKCVQNTTGYPPGNAGCFMTLSELTIGPATVNFEGIEVKETSGPASLITGFFAQNPPFTNNAPMDGSPPILAGTLYHKADGSTGLGDGPWIGIGSLNCSKIGVSDTAGVLPPGFAVPTGGFTNGSYTWAIKMKYRDAADQNGAEVEFATVNQVTTIKNTGEMIITKNDSSICKVSRTP